MTSSRIAQPFQGISLQNVPGPTANTRMLQRGCACGQHTAGGGECLDCKKKSTGTLRRAAIQPIAPDIAPPLVHNVLLSQGQPLDSATRAFMEPRFGYDFSQVRVHTGARAEESAAAVNALAYTVGSNMVFGKGQYTPGSETGRRLIAHELTHVAQQSGSTGAGGEMQIGPSGSPAEREADRNSTTVAAGQQAANFQSAPATTLMREDGEEEEGPGFWATIGGGLVGEFNEDPNFAMIGVDLGVSLIPILDQVSDARDIAAHLYYMIWQNQYNQFMRWVGLIFSLIGLIPEVGSAIKGASKFVIRGIREVLSHLSDILAPFRRLLPEATELNRLFRYVSQNWSRWVSTATSAWDSFLARIFRVLDAASLVFSRRIQGLRDALRRIQEMAPEKLRDAFAWARQRWDEISEQVAERFGRREGTEASAGARRTAERAENAYQTQINQAIADAELRASRRGRTLFDGVQNPMNRRWIEANPRHRQLAFDPVHRGFRDGSVDEARAALLMESRGIGTPPFRRNLEGRSGQADFIDGANVHWDHYMPRGLDITQEVDSLYGKLALARQNVILDAGRIDPIYRRTIIRQLSDRLAREGKSDLLNNIAVIGEEIGEGTVTAIRTARIAGRLLEEDEESAETAP